MRVEDEKTIQKIEPIKLVSFAAKKLPASTASLRMAQLTEGIAYFQPTAAPANPNECPPVVSVDTTTIVSRSDKTPLHQQPVSIVLDRYIDLVEQVPDELAVAATVQNNLAKSRLRLTGLPVPEALDEIWRAVGLPQLAPFAQLPAYRQAFLFLKYTLLPWIQPPPEIQVENSAQTKPTKEQYEKRQTKEMLIVLRQEAEAILARGRKNVHVGKRFTKVAVSLLFLCRSVPDFKEEFQRALRGSENVQKEIPFNTPEGVRVLVVHSDRGDPNTAVISFTIANGADEFLVLSNRSPVTNAYTGDGCIAYTEDHPEFAGIEDRTVHTRFDGKKYKPGRNVTLADAIAWRKLLTDDLTLTPNNTG